MYIFSFLVGLLAFAYVLFFRTVEYGTDSFILGLSGVLMLIGSIPSLCFDMLKTKQKTQCKKKAGSDSKESVTDIKGLLLCRDALTKAEFKLASVETKTDKAIQYAKTAEQSFAETQAKLAEATQRAEVAEQALAEAKAQTTTPQEVVSPSLTPAQRAAQAKSEKSLAAWKEVFPAMMKVYARCMEEGEKPRQGPDFYAMFNELDAELTDTQMRFFRSCLPEGHSDTDGGKPGKV